jgi:hypothetical protein
MPSLDWIIGAAIGALYLYACFNHWTLHWLNTWDERHPHQVTPMPGSDGRPVDHCH